MATTWSKREGGNLQSTRVPEYQELIIALVVLYDHCLSDPGTDQLFHTTSPSIRIHHEHLSQAFCWAERTRLRTGSALVVVAAADAVAAAAAADLYQHHERQSKIALD